MKIPAQGEALKHQIAAKPLEASGEAASIYIYLIILTEYSFQREYHLHKIRHVFWLDLYFLYQGGTDFVPPLYIILSICIINLKSTHFFQL